MNISGEYSAIFTTYVDGQLYVGEYGMRYKADYFSLHVTGGKAPAFGFLADSNDGERIWTRCNRFIASACQYLANKRSSGRTR